VRVFRTTLADFADRIAYASVPLLCYCAGLAASYELLFGNDEVGLYIIAGAALLLLLVNIRNAWDLMISLARRSAERVNRPPSP